MTESEHISDLRWDELIAGDLPAEAAGRARDHVAACARCAARLAALEAEARTFDVPRSRGPGRRRAPIALVAGVAIALAAAALLAIRPREPETRTKGGGGAQLALLGGPRDRVAPLSSGDRIAPGDTLQATYSSARDGFGAVLSRDGAGTTMAYVPSRGDVLVALPAGTGRSFPESTILDAVVGEETIVVVWCESALRVQPLLAELDTRGSVTAPAGCTLHRVVIAKGPR